MSATAEELAADGLKTVDMVVTFHVPVDISDATVERLRAVLQVYATGLKYTRHAEVQTIRSYFDLLFLWNEVQLAAPIVAGMAPADKVWGGMTCTEVQALADIFTAGGNPGVAEFMIGEHGLGDDDPEDVHYEQYLEGRS